VVQQEQQLETQDLATMLGITDPARVERLARVAHGYSGAVGIIDALRIQGWSEDGLTIPQMRLLWALRDEDGLPVGALAEQLGVNPSTITGHVDRLVRQDLVRREEDADDRRIVRNYLTETGAITVGALRRIVGHYFFNIIKRLDDTQLDRLGAALEDLNTAAAEARRESTE
jgi:DNA-binding MarR family transcriptional regulator